MKTPFIKFLLFFLLFTLKTIPLYAQMSENENFSVTNWEYSTAAAPDSSQWHPFQGPIEFKENLNSDFLWLKTTLLFIPNIHPSLYIKRINFPVVVYLDGKQIFQYSGPSTLIHNHFVRRDHVLIPLPQCKTGDLITFKIYPAVKVHKIPWQVYLVSSDHILKNFFLRYMDNFAFSAIFFTTGLVILVLFIISYRLKLLLGIALYLLSLALFITSNNPFLQLLIPAPSWYYHMDYISLISATIGAFFAIEQIIEKRYKGILQTIWIIHLVFLIACILIINLTTATFQNIVHYFLIMLVINMVICITVMIKSARKGEYTAKILFVGMSVFLIFAILEIILFYRDARVDMYSYSVKVLHFGALFFVISLIWIAVYYYVNTYRQKELAQQKELEAVKRANQTREQFAMQLIESQENERNRIALELHDSVGQKLLIIKNMLLSEIRKSRDNRLHHALVRVSDLSGETIQDVRNITYNLRPRHLDQLGLTTAIETVLENLAESSDIRFHPNIADIDNLLPKQDEINFYRIIQESLNNIIKHSQATEAWVEISKSEQQLITVIRDNGIGSQEQSGGLGITGMYERARMIGAEFNIVFTNGNGTEITLNYPIKSRKTDA